MQKQTASGASRQFKTPRKSLGDVTAVDAARLLAAACDIAVVVDDSGRIHDVSTSIAALQRGNVAEWVGKNFLDLLTVEAKPKAERLIKDARAGLPDKRRELNIALQSGSQATIECSAAPVGEKGRIVLLGRDLGVTASIQQRLIAAQAETEREYLRLRQAETRFAVLFETSHEPLLIVAPVGHRIVEVNPAGVALIGKSAKRLLGRALADLFDPAGGRAVAGMLAAIQSVGRGDDVRAQLEGRDVRVSGAVFRHEKSEQFLVRMEVLGGRASTANMPDIWEFIAALPDAAVVVDADFNILRSNENFLEMAQISSEAQVRGQPLDRWLGRPGIDMDALAATLKRHGFTRNFPTVLRGARGHDEDVEVSALTLPDPESPTISITLRSVPRRRASSSKVARELPQSVEQMTELVGRVPLKDMVREATDWIEKLSIEAALIVTDDNRASAADMLGFSRQSLYMKMRRYGLGDNEADDES
ncbi:MAG: transcriptional regulator PpsR [Beijerinckiaceae bacterium]